jgi:hypothetical protein
MCGHISEHPMCSDGFHSCCHEIYLIVTTFSIMHERAITFYLLILIQTLCRTVPQFLHYLQETEVSYDSIPLHYHSID